MHVIEHNQNTVDKVIIVLKRFCQRRKQLKPIYIFLISYDTLIAVIKCMRFVFDIYYIPSISSIRELC